MNLAAAARKDLLRKEALQRRGATEPDVRAAFAARLASEGLALAKRFKARTASAFMSIRDEPDTMPLIAELSASGFRTALPVTVSRDAPLTFRAWRPGDPTVAGSMAIREPSPDAPVIEPDLLFVPLASFDRRGHRIGFGAGHYDRSLAALRASGPITAVGVAYACAETPEIPDQPHDQRLDFVLTERELIDCRSA